jgi:hypothetical protein
MRADAEQKWDEYLLTVITDSQAAAETKPAQSYSVNVKDDHNNLFIHGHTTSLP